MPCAKQTAFDLIESLPDDCTWADIERAIYNAGRSFATGEDSGRYEAVLSAYDCVLEQLRWAREDLDAARTRSRS